MKSDFYDEINKQETEKLRKGIKELPLFTKKFFTGINTTTSISTRIGYAYDLKVFFTYLQKEEPDFYKESIDAYTLEDMSKITVYNLEDYMEYLTFYVNTENEDRKEITNGERGKSRKLSALRTMFQYFCKKGDLEANPALLVEIPKIHEKEITVLEAHEVANLLDEVECGENLTRSQKYFHDKTKNRDLALISLFLGTGMRISELIGIDLNDFDFSNNSVRVIRKGGNESLLFFTDEVAEPVLVYKREREKVETVEGHENAFFLSSQKRRITPRAVQNLVKKYSKIITPLKNISPHKLRSTYGTSLYKESQDIYLVADALGHKNVETTRKHYAKMEEQRRRDAAKHVHLR